MAHPPTQAATIAELQAQLDDFAEIYNQHRPHRSLPHRATPATVYTARPKAAPANRLDTHNRVRTDRIDKPAPSPCATTADCTTSASAEPTPEPAS